jgi:hypothetical protein
MVRSTSPKGFLPLFCGVHGQLKYPCNSQVNIRQGSTPSPVDLELKILPNLALSVMVAIGQRTRHLSSPIVNRCHIEGSCPVVTSDFMSDLGRCSQLKAGMIQKLPYQLQKLSAAFPHLEADVTQCCLHLNMNVPSIGCNNFPRILTDLHGTAFNGSHSQLSLLITPRLFDRIYRVSATIDRNIHNS